MIKTVSSTLLHNHANVTSPRLTKQGKQTAALYLLFTPSTPYLWTGLHTVYRTRTALLKKETSRGWNYEGWMQNIIRMSALLSAHGWDLCN